MDNQKGRIDLGFAKDISEDFLYSLRSHYFPLGKIGGKPSWLNPVKLPASSELCCKANNSSNFVVFRCQLPRVNSYYTSENPIDPDLDGEVPDPYYDPLKYVKLCETCGCRATKKCGKCEKQWYCSREHQIHDWQNGHKINCGNSNNKLVDSNNKMETDSRPDDELFAKKPKVATNSILFPEYGVELGTDYMPNNDATEDSECEDESDEDDDADQLATKLMELKQYENANEISAQDVEGLEEARKDVAFIKFNKILARKPEQIMRYDRGGTPIIATDLAPDPIHIPNCELCGAPRTFEFQLTPHLLALMEVDTLGSSIDWATVIVYTCSKDCEIPDSGYAKEYVFKQDFVLDSSKCIENDGI